MIRSNASLSATMIRRGMRQSAVSTSTVLKGAGSVRSRLHDDVRFFLLAWAIGFVAFLTFIA